MTPAERGGAAGSDWPSIVDVALGAPSVPVTCCWAAAGKNEAHPVASRVRKSRNFISKSPVTVTANGGARGNLPVFAGRDNSVPPIVEPSRSKAARCLASLFRRLLYGPQAAAPGWSPEVRFGVSVSAHAVGVVDHWRAAPNRALREGRRPGADLVPAQPHRHPLRCASTALGALFVCTEYAHVAAQHVLQPIPRFPSLSAALPPTRRRCAAQALGPGRAPARSPGSRHAREVWGGRSRSAVRHAAHVRRRAISQQKQELADHRDLAGAAGLEPATLGFGDRCSTN